MELRDGANKLMRTLILNSIGLKARQKRFTELESAIFRSFCLTSFKKLLENAEKIGRLLVSRFVL
jgi:hypothetical protein